MKYERNISDPLWVSVFNAFNRLILKVRAGVNGSDPNLSLMHSPLFACQGLNFGLKEAWLLLVKQQTIYIFLIEFLSVKPQRNRDISPQFRQRGQIGIASFVRNPKMFSLPTHGGKKSSKSSHFKSSKHRIFRNSDWKMTKRSVIDPAVEKEWSLVDWIISALVSVDSYSSCYSEY